MLEASLMLTWVHAETASVASPTLPGKSETASRTFAAVICEAEVPCSVHTACQYVAFVSAQDTSSVYFCRCSASSECFFCDKGPRESSKSVPVCSPPLLQQWPLCFLRTVDSSQARICVHSLSTAALAAGLQRACRMGTGVLKHIPVLPGTLSLPHASPVRSPQSATTPARGAALNS